MAEPNLMGGLIGGALIGVSALLMLALNGRIAGVSGILGGLLSGGGAANLAWRGAFVAGLIGGAALYGVMHGGLPVELQARGTLLLAAGLMVGFGTRLGGGCTSGHGVCGLARRSPRSVTATLTFMLVAAATVFLIRHVLS